MTTPMHGFQSTLVFRRPDGSFMYEPLVHDGSSREHALREAMCEGHAQAFGRRFVGLSRFEPAPPGPLELDELPTISTTAEATTLSLEPVIPLDEPERVVELTGLGEVAWWKEEGAFGIATELGVALQRAGCRDVEIARRHAELVGEWIAHQTSLYPATATALPFVLTLLEHPELRRRDVLEGWLGVIAEATIEDPVDLDALRAEVERIPLAMREIMFPDGVEARHREGVERGREVRAVMLANRARIEQLAESSETLARVCAALEAPTHPLDELDRTTGGADA